MIYPTGKISLLTVSVSWRRPGWLNWRCSAALSENIHCVCERRDQIYLTLRGLCPESNIDTYWVPRNDNTSKLIYVGITSSQISFNYSANLWELSVVGKKERTVGRADTGFDSLMLGRTSWLIESDSPACNNRRPYSATLKLSGCGEEEFTCSDGQCIDINRRCDQIVHCRDESDEEDCRLLVLKNGYKKNIIPFTVAPVRILQSDKLHVDY